MFYSVDVLSRKGRFGLIWLAATYGGKGKKSLTYREYHRVNIPVACQDIAYPQVQFALRLSSHLMVGVVRIYRGQTQHFYTAMKNFYKHISDNTSKASIDMHNPLPLRKVDVTDETNIVDLDYFSDTCVSPSSSSKDGSDGGGGGGGGGFDEGPYQAPRDKITLPENLDESPFKPIKVPGERDFTGERLDPDDDAPLPESPLPPADSRGSDLRSPLDPPADGAEPPADDDVVVLADETTGEFRPVEPLATPAKDDQRKHHEEGLATPPVPVPESLPSPPRKRRRLAVDRNIKLDMATRRRNVQTSHELQNDLTIGPTMPSAKDLFSLPATAVQQNSWFVEYWNQNAIVRPYSNEELKDKRGSSGESSGPDFDEPEILRREDMSDVEVLRRDARDVSSEFEMSTRSVLDATPEVQPDRSSTGEQRQPKLDPTPQRKSSIMRPGLSPIIDREIEDITEIDDDQFPLPTIGEQPTFMENEVHEPTAIPTKNLSAVIRTIRQKMSDKAEGRLEFDEILPSNPSRPVSGITFYQLLVLHSIGEIILQQEKPYTQIFIVKGPHYGQEDLST